MAFHVSRHLYLAGHEIACIWSRSAEKALEVANASGSVVVTDTKEICGDADFYLLAVSDDAIAEVASRFSGGAGIWMHCAGAVSMGQLGSYFKEHGVLYPIQTLSSQRDISLGDTPFLVEGSSPFVTRKIHKLASSLSRRVMEMDSEGRLKVHLAAVFANNFSNHMVAIASRLLAEEGGDISLLDALLRETFRKMAEVGPEEARTGPALRGDKDTMQKHLDLLKGHPDWEKLYTFVSRDIRSRDTNIIPGKSDE